MLQYSMKAVTKAAKRYIPGFIPQAAVRDLKDHLTSQKYEDDAVMPNIL